MHLPDAIAIEQSASLKARTSLTPSQSLQQCDPVVLRQRPWPFLLRSDSPKDQDIYLKTTISSRS